MDKFETKVGRGRRALDIGINTRFKSMLLFQSLSSLGWNLLMMFGFYATIPQWC